jgi:EAL domain-containing protein (putative c-di-GMP-specific phosphodiesterase class I)
VDTIKIDHSFVTSIADDPRAKHFLSAIIGFAATLGLRVVAEGVETIGQREILAALDCAWVQGFLFGRPQPIETFGLQFKPDSI